MVVDSISHDLLAALGRSSWVNLNLGHHATILMIQNMAVIHQGASNVGIAKIHAKGHGSVWPLTSPIGKNDRIPQGRIRNLHAVNRHHEKVLVQFYLTVRGQQRPFDPMVCSEK